MWKGVLYKHRPCILIAPKNYQIICFVTAIILWNWQMHRGGGGLICLQWGCYGNEAQVNIRFSTYSQGTVTSCGRRTDTYEWVRQEICSPTINVPGGGGGKLFKCPRTSPNYWIIQPQINSLQATPCTRKDTQAVKLVPWLAKRCRPDILNVAYNYYYYCYYYYVTPGNALAYLVASIHHKPVGCGFESRWIGFCFPIYPVLPTALWRWLSL
jgi:hypothetical protein